ncbi:MAG TPA: GDSL-type esterase/lipase family protein, partial [Thermoanaerobaculia bacterium]|nr:GDSL-type esterase/lipase family protein [Thermoanaerobaculia bacterium]
VAFLGGSTTECMFVDERMRFPARASFLLETRGIRINALNAGVSGNDAHDAVNNLLNYVVQDEPHVAVLMEASNDIGNLRVVGGYQFSMGRAPSLAMLGRLVFTKLSAYSSIAALMRHTMYLRRNKQDVERHARRTERQAAQLPAQPGGPLPVEKFRQRLRTFVAVSRAFGITPVLMTQPSHPTRNELTPSWYDPAAQALFNQAIREVAAEQKAELIDLVAFVNARPRSPQPLFYDGIHVTDYGADVYAQHIADRLQEIVATRRQTAAQ